jgi:hypothetical protein
MSSPIDKVIGIALGSAFGVRVLDDRKALWARAAYGAVAYDLITTALRTGEALGKAPVGPQKSAAGEAAQAGRNSPSTPLNFEERRVRTIEQRVAFVHEQMVKGTRDPVVYGLAREVLSRKGPNGSWAVPEKDHWGEVQALFWEVRKRVRYVWDPTDYDAFQTPRKTLAIKSGDCDDTTALLGAMLRSVGYKVRSRIVQTKGESSWNHIYLMADVPGRGWTSLDPTVQHPPGWEVPKQFIIQKQDFAVQEAGGAPKVKEESR